MCVTNDMSLNVLLVTHIKACCHVTVHGLLGDLLGCFVSFSPGVSVSGETATEEVARGRTSSNIWSSRGEAPPTGGRFKSLEPTWAGRWP